MDKPTLSAADRTALKSFVALARAIGFPRGKDTRDWTVEGEFSRPSCSLDWSKHGGHAGRTKVDACLAKARAAGFVAFDSTRHSMPDGSRVGHGDVLVKVVDGVAVATLRSGASYGAVAADNFFYLTLEGLKLTSVG